jgi:hypothetical protein
MTNDKKRHEDEAAKIANKNPRQDRLRQALRENLKRRKSQARGRGDVTIAPLSDDEVPPYGGNGKNPGE